MTCEPVLTSVARSNVLNCRWSGVWFAICIDWSLFYKRAACSAEVGAALAVSQQDRPGALTRRSRP
jgi:hypothetical protein